MQGLFQSVTRGFLFGYMMSHQQGLTPVFQREGWTEHKEMADINNYLEYHRSLNKCLGHLFQNLD